MKTLTLTALSMAGIFALSGCSATGETSISGRAIDPYLAGATVCLADDDRVCLSDEASVTTDEQGNYTLTVSGKHFGESHQVVVTGGRDVETNATFTGTVVALHEANATASLNITPLTTWLVAEYREANASTHATRRQLEESLSGRYGLDFHADVVAAAEEGNTTGLRVSVELARSAELYDANGTFGFYVYVAREHNATSTDARLKNAATHAEEETGGTGLRRGVDAVIDAANDAHSTAHDIAKDAHDTAHGIAEDVHGFFHDSVCSVTQTCNDHNHTTHTTHVGG